jgi:hypothetical protein
VLHTWGQNLHHHPHVHCLVPGGGPSPDDARWIAAAGLVSSYRSGCSSRLFRRLFLDELAAAFRAGSFSFFGEFAGLAADSDDAAMLFRDHAAGYSKMIPPPGGALSTVLIWMFLGALVKPVGVDGPRRHRMYQTEVVAELSKGDRPWNRLAVLAWIRRSSFSSFTE